MRARLALAVSSVAYTLREVALKNKPADMMAASRKGTVPVLVLASGQVIDESLDIMHWALDHNDPGGWLHHGSSGDMQALICANDGPFKHALDRYKYPNQYSDEYPPESSDDPHAFALAQRFEAARWLQTLEPQLSNGWLFGHQASLADMACLPFIRQFAHTDKAWFASQRWPHLQAWLAAFEVSALFGNVMSKHAPWAELAVERPTPAPAANPLRD